MRGDACWRSFSRTVVDEIVGRGFDSLQIARSSECFHAAWTR